MHTKTCAWEFIAALFKTASLVVQRLKRLPAMWETWVRALGREDLLEKERATHSSILASPENPMDAGAWWGTVAKSWTRLSDFTFTYSKLSKF